MIAVIIRKLLQGCGKIEIANLGGPVKRRIKLMKGTEGKYFKLQ